jgi:RNA polymerase sigma-70 factor (ECF subfamily)
MGTLEPDETKTSRSLISRARAREAQAWERLVQIYAPLVSRWCHGAGLQECDEADVVQEVFRAVSQNLARFRNDRPGDSFRAWLHTLTRSKIHDFFRARKRAPLALGGSTIQRRLRAIPVAETSSAAQAREEDSEIASRALQWLRTEFEERTWRAFLRTAVDRVPAKDVGAELGMSAGAVRVARSRVLKRLREELADLGIEVIEP